VHADLAVITNVINIERTCQGFILGWKRDKRVGVCIACQTSWEVFSESLCHAVYV
jgi:hypothetical protein